MAGKPTIVELEAMLDSDSAGAIAINPDGSINVVECHGLDTAQQVFFYENDFYVLSNFSAFVVRWGPYDFATSEQLYHWRRFHLAGGGEADTVARRIMLARSAHDAFRIAQDNKALQYRAWNEIKVNEMRSILRAKAEQHEYVRRKLLGTGNRELIENSWRDDFWGWGPNRDGQNMLGKLWMEIRSEIVAGQVKPLTEVLGARHG